MQTTDQTTEGVAPESHPDSQQRLAMPREQEPTMNEASDAAGGGGVGGECRCLEIVREKLEKHHGEGSDVELELKATIIMDPEAENYGFGAALPPLYYTYKAGKKRKKSYVTYSFCPFCGRSSR